MFDLRWCLNYQDGRTKRGLWSNDSLSYLEHSIEGLSCANIEGKNLANQKQLVFASIKSDDFCTFQWIATAPVKYGFHRPKIIGMVLVGREYEILIYIDGKMIPRPRSWDDKLMKYGKV